MAAFTHDIFFVGKDGFDEHIQITSDDVVEGVKNREILIKGLVESGATTRPSGASKFGKPAAGVAKSDGMATAANEVFGTQIGVECENGCGPMKFVASGISRTSGKPYPAFYSCKQCGAKKNAPRA